jgi:hypothetical protein
MLLRVSVVVLLCGTAKLPREELGRSTWEAGVEERGQSECVS